MTGFVLGVLVQLMHMALPNRSWFSSIDMHISEIDSQVFSCLFSFSFPSLKAKYAQLR